MKRALALALLVIAFACSRTSPDRTHWQRMSPREKQLYVRSLLGHEEAKRAKGGNERTFPRSPDEYVQLVDAAYARGETRAVDAVFESLGERTR